MFRGLSPGQRVGYLPPIRYMLISQYYDTNKLTDYKKQELT